MDLRDKLITVLGGPSKEEMARKKDVQNSPASIQLELDEVGVVGVRKYLTIKRDSGPYQFVVTIDSLCKMTKEYRGLNMSRFAEAIEEVGDEFESLEDFTVKVATENKKRHNAESKVLVESLFPYKITRPNGKIEKRVYDFSVWYTTEKDLGGVKLVVPGVSCCPCALENTGKFSHNQRAFITVEVEFNCRDKPPVKAGVLVNTLNSCFSAPVFTTLKRDEEAALVIKAHENARFCEDICRQAVLGLRDVRELVGRNAVIEIKSMESIHPHDVVAVWRGVL
jgi:GTP cyclohydrolase I